MLSALSTDNSPFDAGQLEQLRRGLAGLSQDQSLWLSGYLAGRLAGSVAEAAEAEARPTLTILYGSETGNGEAFAGELATRFAEAGVAAELRSLDGFRPAGLRKLGRAVFVMSTHGEGDPPEEALDLFEWLDSERAPRLPDLRYRVLALGDSSYERFCEAGRRLDERLAALGARRFGPRVDCDVDYAGPAQAWGAEVLAWARERQAPAETRPPARPAARLSVVPARPAWTREQPFEAEILRHQPITAVDSDKEVMHLELSLEGAQPAYEPGDALGVWAPNDPEVVAEILSWLELRADSPVRTERGEWPLAEALAEHFELTRLSAETVTAYAAAAGRPDLAEHFAALPDSAGRRFIEQRQFADLVQEFPGRPDAQRLAEALRPLSPRSYSIASSRALVDQEVHLTVATLRSQAIGGTRTGVATGHLNHRLGVGGRVRVFPEPNRRFHLPEDRSAPLVLVAAGTGIAPYRAFLQELEAAGAAPDTWLVFGNPHLRHDFLYQREWLQWRSRGLLSRIDTAWSRDGEHKRYVQHVLCEQGARLVRWLDRGAHVYVCGGLAMGHAVIEALQQALARHRGLSAEDAARALADLRREKRLKKDLY